MKIFHYAVLAVLVILAVSSGIAKVMLVERETVFFSQYGFSNSILIAFGAAQLVGAILLALPKTRVIGAMVVAITFLISAIVLILSGNIPVAGITFIAMLLLVFIVKQSPSAKTSEIDT